MNQKPFTSFIMAQLEQKIKTPFSPDQYIALVDVLNKCAKNNHLLNAGGLLPLFKNYYLVLMFGRNLRKSEENVFIDRRHSISIKRYLYFVLLMSCGILISTYISLVWITHF